MKVCKDCGVEIFTRDGVNRCEACEDIVDSDIILNQKKKVRRRRRKSAMQEAAESCGLVRVRGAMGGIYYE